MKRLLPLILLLFVSHVSQSQEEHVGFRLIAVRTEAEASRLRTQIQTGASFESLAKEHSIDPSANSGGYMGFLRLSDLNPEFQRALNGLAPGRTSAVTAISGEFVLLQRLSPEESNWIASNDAGLQAFERGSYDAAAQSFRQAVQYAEKLKPVDYRLEDSLHGLAESYRLQKKYSEAEPFYRRYLATHWGGATAPEVLDRCSALIALSYFRDSQFDEALRKFLEGVSQAPLREDTYQAMSGLLFKAQLIPEAEALMVRAVQLFPASKDVRYYQAQLYLAGGKSKKALDVFELLSRMKAPAGIDQAVDRLQQSVVYQKIATIRAELVEFDAAATAYKKALELTPDSWESRLGLGDIYLRQSRSEDALAEYSQVISSYPQNASAHFRIAQANLGLGRFPEAAMAAAKALAINPGHRTAHYVQATALVRMDRKDDAEKALELYRKIEADAQSAINRARDIVVLNRGAAAKLQEGRPEEAIEMFLKIIESYPDSPAHYLNLGIMQSRLNRHKAAVETFQKMLSLGMVDNFLLYRNLSQEYRVLGDVEESRRHEVVYLQNLDVALREALEGDLQ